MAANVTILYDRILAVSVSGTRTETDLLSATGVSGSRTIDADGLKAGDVLRITGTGQLHQGVNTPQTVEFRFKFPTTLQSLTVPLNANAGDGGFWFQCLITVQAINPLNFYVLQTDGIFCATDGLSKNLAIAPVNTSNTNSKVANDIKLTVELSTDDANLGMMLDECLIEWLNRTG